MGDREKGRERVWGEKGGVTRLARGIEIATRGGGTEERTTGGTTTEETTTEETTTEETTTDGIVIATMIDTLLTTVDGELKARLPCVAHTIGDTIGPCVIVRMGGSVGRQGVLRTRRQGAVRSSAEA